MTVKIFRFILFSALIGISWLNVLAQPSVAESAKKRPFSVGETLVYEGKISKIIPKIPVAEMTFTVVNAPNNKDFLIKAEAVSKGTLLKIFRFSFLQQIDSTIDITDFRALKTTKHDVQKERVRDSEAVFNYSEDKVTYVETDPKNPMRPPRTIASAIEDQTHDIISGIYALRLLPLEVGKTFELNVSDTGLVYKIPVRVTARELQKTALGKFWCFRVEPEVFGENRFIEQKGKMIIWITDDARRLPIRSQLNTEVGKIEVKIKTAKGLNSANS